MIKEYDFKNRIFLFLILWNFFFFDNAFLRINPFFFWPLACMYSLCMMRSVTIPMFKYLTMVFVGLGYCFISALFSPNMKEGVSFIIELLLYIFPSLYITQVCPVTSIVKTINLFSLVHAIFVYIQYLFPSLFYLITSVFLSSDNISEIYYNAINSDIYSGITGQTSTISLFLILGMISALYFYQRTSNLFFLLEYFAFFSAIALTNRRANTICAIILLFLFLMIYNKKVIEKLSFLICITVLICLFGVGWIPGVSGIINKFNILYEQGHLLSGRFELWNIAFELFLDNWLFGAGMFAIPFYTNYVNAHNSYLQKLCELGSLGFIVYLMPFFYVVYCNAHNYFTIKNNLYKINVALCILFNVYILLISISEGVLETHILYIIIFMFHFISLSLNEYSEKKSILGK